jgi:hypothetical protein
VELGISAIFAITLALAIRNLRRVNEMLNNIKIELGGAIRVEGAKPSA